MGLDQYLYERTTEQDKLRDIQLEIKLKEGEKRGYIESIDDQLYESEIFRWRKDYKLQYYFLKKYSVENCKYFELDVEALEKLGENLEGYNEAIRIAKESIHKGNRVYYYYWD